eukprot:3033298-Pyramimonas_sp.AAC.1
MSRLAPSLQPFIPRSGIEGAAYGNSRAFVDHRGDTDVGVDGGVDAGVGTGADAGVGSGVGADGGAGVGDGVGDGVGAGAGACDCRRGGGSQKAR